MSRILEHLQYHQRHQWLEDLGDGRYRLGITDPGQARLGAVVYVELPAPERSLEASELCGVLESVKAASDLSAAVAGDALERNEPLGDHPEWINSDPYGRGWLLILRSRAGLSELLDAAAYAALVEGQ